MPKTFKRVGNKFKKVPRCRKGAKNMEILKKIEISSPREFTTPGGVFISFIPHLFKGNRGNLIMVEKAIIEKISAGEPVSVKEKSNDKGKYFVIRTPKGGEDKFHLFSISCGGGQDCREDYGFFKVKNIGEGVILYDISSGWGDNHEVLIALKDGGYAEIEGNNGAGFKGRHPQPDFLIRLKSDGSQESITDLDVS